MNLADALAPGARGKYATGLTQYFVDRGNLDDDLDLNGVKVIQDGLR